MSYVVAAPELMLAAGRNLSVIDSSLREVAAAAAGPTTGLATAAADEVSTAISELFGGFGQEFQVASARAAAFHADFVRLVNGGAASYLDADVAAAAAVAPPGGAYQQLFTNTAANLQALGGAWSADPFPFLRQVAANQQRYAQLVATDIANLPATLPQLPAAIEAAGRDMFSFNAATGAQQFIAVQAGFAQTFFTSAVNGSFGLITGLPNFASGLGVATQTLLTGNFTGAVSDFGRAGLGLLVTGVDPGQIVIGGSGLSVTLTPLNAAIDLTAGLSPRILGPLGDLFTILSIPGQEAQYLTDLMPPSIPRQLAQNFTNVLNTLTVPSISAFGTLDATLAPTPSATASLSTFFGLPLVATYAAAGAPLATLNAVANSAETFGQALTTGNYLGAAATLFDAPAAALNGFLNGDLPIDTIINVPVPNIGTIGIVLHLPSDGLLVPPHPVTATVNVPDIPVGALGVTLATIPGTSTPVTIAGTPFSGLLPILVNYVPQQLALAITPAA